MLRLKANESIAGRKCGWCRLPLTLESDAAVCAECRAWYHAVCWDDKGGCVRSGCIHEPPRRGGPVAEPGIAPGTVPGTVPGLGRVHVPVAKPRSMPVAPVSGKSSGPKPNAPGAAAALVCGIVAFPILVLEEFGILAGIVLAIVAIVCGVRSQGIVRKNPRFGGAGLGVAGMVLGIVYLSILAFLFFIVFALFKSFR